MTTRITYYPAIEDKTVFRDQLVRAIWYLNPIQSKKITIFSKFLPQDIAALDAFTPEVAASFNNLDNILKLETGLLNEQDLTRSDILICWNGIQVLESDYGKDFVARLKENGTHIFDVEYTSRTESSKYIDISHRYLANDDEVLSSSKQKLLEICEKHRDVRKSYLFCSGPEIRGYRKHKYSDGIRIVCNSVINDEELLKAVKPSIQIFGDPIFHFGCSTYAHAFRQTLLNAYKEYGFDSIIPIKYYNLLISWVPELEDSLVAVPFDVTRPINLNLLDEFVLHTTDNILTFLMLPVAATLSDEIYLLGCDGRPISQNDYFWKHNEKTQFVDEMDNIKEVHPSFFKLDYDEYYLRHCNNVEDYFRLGESNGLRFQSLTPSFIPALKAREHSSPRPSNPGVSQPNPNLEHLSNFPPDRNVLTSSWERESLEQQYEHANLQYDLEILKHTVGSQQLEIERLNHAIAQLLSNKNNHLNVANFQHFSRYLDPIDAEEIAAEWAIKLGFQIEAKTLIYLANRICVIENSCLGRLATDICDALVRLLCILSINDDRLEYLEIGTLFGINLAIAGDFSRHRFNSMHLTCIDPFEGYYGVGVPDVLTGIEVNRKVLQQNLERVQIPDSDVTVLQGFSDQPEIVATASQSTYNFVLIDGDHSYEGVEKVFDNYAKLVKPDGYLLIDDYGSPEWPEIRQFVDNRVMGDDRFSVVGSLSRTLILRRI